MHITLDVGDAVRIAPDRIAVDVVFTRGGVPIAGQLIVDAALATHLSAVGKAATDALAVKGAKAGSVVKLTQ